MKKGVTKMGITDELVSNILETRFEDFPKDVVEHAKNEVIDIIGCVVGGGECYRLLHDTGSDP
ncbi:hypothetical protein ACFL1Z_07570 [Thermodesulfobacteriota bacterium]